MSHWLRAAPSEITLSDSAVNGQTPQAPTRVQLMRTGKFKSEKYGKFEITHDVLLSMKKNFEANARGIELAVDYSHASDKEAAAWFKGLAIESEGKHHKLMADVVWTPSGGKKVAEREYRYLSADFTFNYESNESQSQFGPTLLGAGLTNRPFIKGMDAVVNLDEDAIQMNEHEKKIKELQDQLASLEAKTKEVEALHAKLKEHEDKDLKLAEQVKLTEKKGQFDKLMSEGKAVEAQRESFMSGDMVKFSELAQAVKLTPRGSGASANGSGGTDSDPDPVRAAQNEILEKARKLLSEKKAANLGAAISMVLSEKSNIKLRETYESGTMNSGAKGLA